MYPDVSIMYRKGIHHVSSWASFMYRKGIHYVSAVYRVFVECIPMYPSCIVKVSIMYRNGIHHVS